MKNKQDELILDLPLEVEESSAYEVTIFLSMMFGVFVLGVIVGYILG